MTKKSDGHLRRDSKGLPTRKDIAHIRIDHEKNLQIIIKKNMLINQIQRDGPKIARSFDRLTKTEIEKCSELVARCSGILLEHLPSVDDKGSKATSARLLSSAINSFIASIEVARHGYPRQYGALARMVV
ncbi:hypothetical protein [Yoonia sp. MH D7]